jgi:phospholipid/cholesterol/gamma-HCH transport system ATP-binding protein
MADGGAAPSPAQGAAPEHQETVIEVRGLVNRFGSQVVHEGLDLDVYRGEVLGVVGGSGTGKSVLLRTIVGLNRPAAGSIRVFGLDVLTASDAEIDEVSRRWGVLFQQGALFSALTVQQNVEAPMRELLEVAPPLRAALAQLKVSMVGLPQTACDKYPSELSGGMQKRAGLARALALDPDIVFLDEPTAGLDPIGASAFDDLIRQLKESLGLTVFMVTHDLDSLHAVCDRIAVLAHKKVLVTGTIADMLKVDDPWVREYFHGPRARAAFGTA